MTPQHTRKLHTALIETGKEVESMVETPDIADMEDQFRRFKAVAQVNDMKAMRKYGRRLSAMVVKWMVEKL